MQTFILFHLLLKINALIYMPFPYLTVQPLSAGGVSLFIALYPPDLAIRSGTESIPSMF